MKATKRIFAILMCICLLLCFAVPSAFAAADGTITINSPTDSTVGVANKTFEIYKIFDATSDGTNISYSWIDNDRYSTFFNDKFGTTDLLTIVDKVNDLEATALQAFATDLYKYISDNSIAATDTKTAGGSDTSVVFTGKDYGYYLVYDSDDIAEGSVRSAVMLTSAAPNANITLKVDLPSITKQVLNNEDAWAKGTSSTIGDPLKFKITAEVPDHKDYPTYTYKIQDSLPAGITLDPATIVVTSEKEGALTEDTDYTLTAPGTDGIDFIITMANIKDFEAGDNIIVTYTAELNNKFFLTDENAASLIYSNDPTDKTSTGTVSDFAKVHSYRFIFTKYAQDVDGSPRNLRLAGAEFELYKAGSNEPIKFTEVPDTNAAGVSYTKYIVDPDGENTTTTLKTHNTGDATISLDHLNYGGHLGDVAVIGLSEGVYHLVETKAPDGYVLPSEPFIVDIYDNIGSITGVVTELEASGSHSGTGSIINVDGRAEAILTVWAEITNKPGTALPETGGMGTTIFTIGGILLMAGALAFFTLRKRSNAV